MQARYPPVVDFCASIRFRGVGTRFRVRISAFAGTLFTSPMLAEVSAQGALPASDLVRSLSADLAAVVIVLAFLTLLFRLCDSFMRRMIVPAERHRMKRPAVTSKPRYLRRRRLRGPRAGLHRNRRP